MTTIQTREWRDTNSTYQLGQKTEATSNGDRGMLDVNLSSDIEVKLWATYTNKSHNSSSKGFNPHRKLLGQLLTK
jgi:hypothetical protein